MKKLVIIYGAPRTGTTAMLEALVQHHQCFGAKLKGNPRSTNENPKVGMPGGISKLWDQWVPEGEDNCLVLKAPGYCSMYDYFSSLEGYKPYFIFTDRDHLEVIDSMMAHESNFVLDMDLESTSCPESMKEVIEPLWNKNYKGDLERKVNRSALRYLWHVLSICSEMKREGFYAHYLIRKSYITLMDRLCSHLDIDPSDRLVQALSSFYHREITCKRRTELNLIIDEAIINLLVEWELRKWI